MSDRQRESRRPPKGLRYVVYAGLGLVVVMMLALSAAVFLGGSGPAAPDIPPTEFSYDYDGDNETLRVTFVNGSVLDASNTDQIAVVTNGSARHNFTLPLEEGTVVNVEGVPNRSQVQVVWRNPAGNEFPLDRTRVIANRSA
jgi:hypothetical protein